jgi:hypothetical protein
MAQKIVSGAVGDLAVEEPHVVVDVEDAGAVAEVSAMKARPFSSKLKATGLASMGSAAQSATLRPAGTFKTLDGEQAFVGGGADFSLGMAL